MIQQPIGNVVDVCAQDFDPRRGKCLRCKAAQPGMRRRVKKNHLLDHDLGDGIQRGQPHGGELLGRGGARSRVLVQHLDHILVTRDDPRVQKGVPVHRIFGAKPVEKRVRVGEDLGIKQVIEAQNTA